MKRISRALIACAAAAVPLPAAPAAAHSGGRAQLYVESVRLEPEAAGWRAELVVRDADSGQAEPGFGVQLSASGEGGRTTGPVSLSDPDADGRYSGVVPLTEGAWTVTVKAEDIPGGPQGLPFQRTWPATLVSGRSAELGARSGAPERSGGGGLPVVPLGLGAVVAAAIVVTRRYRPAQGCSLSRRSAVEKTPT